MGARILQLTVLMVPVLSGVSLGLAAKRPQWLFRIVRLSGQFPYSVNSLTALCWLQRYNHHGG